MSPDTAKKLGKKGIDEYWSLQQHLMTQLNEHNLTDGYDFFTRCEVVASGGVFSIHCEGEPIDGISSKRRDVIQVLFDDASTQLGR